MPIAIHENLRDDVKAHAEHFNKLEESLLKLDPLDTDKATERAKLTKEMEEARRLFNVLGGASGTVAPDLGDDEVPTINRQQALAAVQAITTKKPAPVTADLDAPAPKFVSAADSLAAQAKIQKDALDAQAKLASLQATASQAAMGPIAVPPSLGLVPPVGGAPFKPHFLRNPKNQSEILVHNANEERHAQDLGFTELSATPVPAPSAGKPMNSPPSSPHEPDARPDLVS